MTMIIKLMLTGLKKLIFLLSIFKISFFCEGSSSYNYIPHEEDPYSMTDTVCSDDETIPISNIYNNIVDVICFND